MSEEIRFSLPNAFPLVFDGLGGRNVHTGMSLRDWFAGQLAAHMEISRGSFQGERFDWAEWAKNVYRAADALLDERGPDNVVKQKASP